MNRKLVVAGLSAAMSLALMGMPVSAKSALPKAVAQGKVARIAPAGGVLTKARLRVAGGQAAPNLSWVSAGTLAQAVEENGGGAYASSRVYVPGGFIEFTTPTLYPYIQIYNGTTWAADTSQLMPAVDPSVGQTGWGDAAVCSDSTGKIHVVNGTDGAFLYAAHQVYDPAAPAGSRWSFASLPVLADGTTWYSQDSVCFVINGVLYLSSGYSVIDPPGTALINRDTWAYDASTDTWTNTNKLMNTGRLWSGYTVVASGQQGLGFVAGGTNDINTFIPTATTEKFSPSTGWANMAPLPSGAGGGRLAPGMGAAIASGIKIVVFGGGTGTGPFTLQATTLFCSGACTSWANTGANLNTARWFMGWASGNIGTAKFYAAGGDDGTGPIASAEKFTP